MTHHCPACGEFSWHGPGSNHWALRCPFCKHVAKQHAHAPTTPPRATPPPLVGEQGPETVVVPATTMVVDYDYSTSSAEDDEPDEFDDGS